MGNANTQLDFGLDGAGGLKSPALTAAIQALSDQGGVESRGVVFTKVEVVEFILDLVGYTADQPLHDRRILEPSFGGGDFLMPVIDRLLGAWSVSKSAAGRPESLAGALRAVEVHPETFASTRASVIERLRAAGLSSREAAELAAQWLVCGDFLLVPVEGEFDYVVGNPPYVRPERIPGPLLAVYRSRYSTMYDRADLYVPFIERSLTLLAQRGRLGFVCPDRWMKNRYGGPLRSMVADRFRLRVCVDLAGLPAFHSEVTAYPAVTVIGREETGPTRVARPEAIEREALGRLARQLGAESVPEGLGPVRELACVPDKGEPWLMDFSEQTAVLRRLEKAFPTLEQSGCKVAIGVATGADECFIGEFEGLDVEADRKLRLVTTRDIESGQVRWGGLGVVNPFADEGGLVDLGSYPRLRCYLEARREVIAGRHCARKTPSNWYRTIDRITPSLALKPKLLIPDIKGGAHVVFDSGGLYPHHNLYYVTSVEWDLRALQAVLMSAVTRLFVAAYSTKMQGGCLRFQAQYLRRVRLPRWSSVSERARCALRQAAESGDVEACNKAVFPLFGLSQQEESAITTIGG